VSGHGNGRHGASDRERGAGPASAPAEPADPLDESCCRRCGQCCCKKLIHGETIYYTPFDCRFLGDPTETDGRTERLCTVYAARFRRNPRCRTAADGVEMGLFPADCPYARGIPGYVPPVADWLRHPEILAAARGALSAEELFGIARALETTPEEMVRRLRAGD